MHFEQGRSRQDDFENPRPENQRNQQFRRSRRGIMISQTTRSLKEEHDGHPERNANQIVQARMHEARRPHLFQNQAIDEIRRQAKEEQGIAKISKGHRSVVFQGKQVNGSHDYGNQDRKEGGK